MVQVQASQFCTFLVSNDVFLLLFAFSCGVGVHFFLLATSWMYSVASARLRYLLAVVQVTRMRCTTNVVWQTSFQALLYPLNFTITVPWSVAFWSIKKLPTWQSVGKVCLIFTARNTLLDFCWPRFWIGHDRIVCFLPCAAFMEDFRFFQLGSSTSRTSRTWSGWYSNCRLAHDVKDITWRKKILTQKGDTESYNKELDEIPQQELVEAWKEIL